MFFWNSMKFHSAYLNHFKKKHALTSVFRWFLAPFAFVVFEVDLPTIYVNNAVTQKATSLSKNFCATKRCTFWKLHCMFFIKWLRKLFFSVNLMGFWCPLSFQHSLRAKQLASGRSGQPVDLTLSYFGNKSLQYLTHEMIQMIFWSEADMRIQAPKGQLEWSGWIEPCLSAC